ncbi:hypothetical protein APHAL10511_004745 [Amanita phalloides]|nr:hypothetical protein APHAL10511_004745 [Amanita phalloides]
MTPPIASPPTLDELKAQVAKAKQALSPIRDTVHGLVDQNGPLHPDVQKLFDRMKQQDLNHEISMSHIDDLISELLEQDGDEDIEDQIKREMDKQIAAIVKKKVAEELKDYASEERQKELNEIHAKIARLEIELHNSESRRRNAFLKLDTSPRVLSTIKTLKTGAASQYFPKTTRELHRLDGGTVAKLMIDYEISSPKDPMPLRLNKFVQFCGLR